MPLYIGSGLDPRRSKTKNIYSIKLKDETSTILRILKQNTIIITTAKMRLSTSALLFFVPAVLGYWVRSILFELYRCVC